MPLIPPRKVWVSAGVAKSRKRNRLEIVRAITHPFEREKRAVSESIAGRKRLLLAHAVPQRTGLSNSIFRLCKLRRRWRSRPLLIGSVDALPSTSRSGAATVVSADVGKLPECLGFIPETSASFDLWSNFGAAQGRLGTYLKRFDSKKIHSVSDQPHPGASPVALSRCSR